jgi:hypothetical protein
VLTGQHWRVGSLNDRIRGQARRLRAFLQPPEFGRDWVSTDLRSIAAAIPGSAQCSLAFLAFYRDWLVLITGSVVVAADHLVRGLYLAAVDVWH